jgi:hypothetical protein
VWRLADVPPDVVVPFLRRSLKPAVPDAAAVRRLVADLDGDDFTAREKAPRELEQQGPGVIPAVRQALTEGRSDEARRRLEAVLKRLGNPRLRPARVVALVERVGTATALELLEDLAHGAEGSPETREARAALERMGRGMGKR